MKTGLSIGQNIRKWRMFKGYKQQTLAKRLGVSKAAISNMENDKTAITLQRLEMIAAFLEITLPQLLTTPEDWFDKKGLPFESSQNGLDKNALSAILQQRNSWSNTIKHNAAGPSPV